MNPVQVALWYFRLRPYFDRIQKLCSMKLSTNVFSQMLAVAIQMANQFSGIVPAKYQPFVVLVVGVAQLIVGFIAHFSPVPGTVPVVPEVK